MKSPNPERVLGRRGARVLTPGEIETISGAAWQTSTQRTSMVANHPDLLLDND